LKQKKIKKICVVLVNRANYGRLKPVMEELKSSKDFDLQVVCAGSMLLDRFGQAEKVVEEDGFPIHGRIYTEVEGSTPASMSKSIGIGIMEFTSEFTRLDPDIVLIIGDRYEALAAAVSAAYMNIFIAHIQGGELSGSIDESARHVITKLSHLHFPATKRAAEYILRMGEREDSVFNFGCPVGDYILNLDNHIDNKLLQNGVGNPIDTNSPFFLVIYHPVTTLFNEQANQAHELLLALDKKNIPTLWLWPNIDAGSDIISKEIRRFREMHNPEWLYLLKNIDPENFQKLLKKAICAIGNSSSFIRDTTFTGTPVVLVGDRQYGREHGKNLISCKPEQNQILDSINHQLQHGRYASEGLYGDGTAAPNIVKTLKNFTPYVQKTLQYPLNDEHSNH